MVDIRAIYLKPVDSLFEQISIFVIVLITISSLVVLRKLLKDRDLQTLKYNLYDVIEKKTLTIDYILLYVFPLMAFDFTSFKDVCLFLIFFLVLSFLEIKHHCISSNIVFELMGYSVYECRLKCSENDPEPKKQYIICKNNLIIKKVQILRLN